MEYKCFAIRLTWNDGSGGWYAGTGTRTTNTLIKAKLYPTVNLAKQSNPHYLKKTYSSQDGSYSSFELEIVPVVIKEE